MQRYEVLGFRRPGIYGKVVLHLLLLGACHTVAADAVTANPRSQVLENVGEDFKGLENEFA